MKNRFLLLQINDSIFPIGGYTQSYGLETYIQKGLVKDADTAFLYVTGVLHGSFLYTELLSARYAYDYALSGEYEKLAHLDQLLRASKVPKEIRNASEKLGQRFIKTIQGMQLPDNERFTRYCDGGASQPPNHCVAYGVLCASAGIPKEDALQSFMYSNTSSIITNCVKLVPLSQTVGQNLLAQCHDVFETVLQKVTLLKEDQIGLSMPGFDVRCMQHETLYSRLYMS